MFVEQNGRDKMKQALVCIIILPLLLIAAQWQALNTPHFGTGTDINIGLYQTEYYIYVADEMYMMYMSTNNGEYWDSLVESEYAHCPICVITDPADAQIAYLGKSDAANNNPPPYNTIFKTTNGGQSWFLVSDENIGSKVVSCFAMHPDYPDTVYVGFDLSINQSGNQGMYKTTNGGNTWFQSGDVEHTVHDIFVHPDDPDILYAATDSSVRKTTNGGTNWLPLNAPGDIIATYSVTVKTPDTVFVITADPDYGKIWKTTDDGENWTCVLTSPLKPDYDLDILPRGIQVDNNNQGLMYAIIRPFGFYKSTNGGNTWAPSNTGIGDKHLYSLCQHPGISGCLFAGGCVAMYKSTDNGTTWTEKTEGMRLASVSDVSATGGVICAGTTIPADDPMICGITQSTDAGAHFSWIYHTNLHYLTDVEIAPTSTNMIFGAYRDAHQTCGFVVRTSNSGAEWEVDCFPGYGIEDLAMCSSSYDSIRTCSYQPASPSPATRVWWTDEYGGAWDYHQFSFTGNLHTIETDPLNSQTIYTGGYWWISPPEANHGPVVKKSTDGGATWNDARNGIAGRILDIAIDPANNQILYAASDSGPYKTTDAGGLWTKKITGLSEYYSTDVLIDPEEPSIQYALLQQDASSTTNSLYCTVDGAVQWFEFALPAGQNPPSYINEITIDNSQANRIYAGTFNGIHLFYPEYNNKHLVSSVDTATFTNNGRNMMRIEGTDEIWVTYESGGVIYVTYTTNAGFSWSKKMELGQGSCPAISYDPIAETPIPGVVWRYYDTEEVEYDVYFSRYTGSNQWSEPEIVASSESAIDPPSFAIGGGNVGHLAYTEGSTVKYAYFSITNPSSVTRVSVGTGHNPCIGYMISGTNPNIHIVWEYDDQIWYRYSPFGLGSPERVSSSITDCYHPSLVVNGNVVYFAWEADGDISWRWITHNYPFTQWGAIKQVCSTGEINSSYPVLTSGYYCSWVEEQSSAYEVYAADYDPEETSWNTPQNISDGANETFSNLPHIVHKQTLFGTTVYFIWTEGYEGGAQPTAPPYRIVFTTEIFGGAEQGGGDGLPMYIAECGEETASPFTVRREGYTCYGTEPYKQIDYDTQYLEYQFTHLDPDRIYMIQGYLYQRGSSNL
jgi:photosystem II stability/assembly factor-like uncharacterized protein